MIEIDLITGFLGSGKTTLLNKLLPQLTKTDLVAVVENDYGDISIDAQIVENQNEVTITELSAGCVCCSLRGELIDSITQLSQTLKPDRIVIEPSGVARTSDMLHAFSQLKTQGIAKLGHIFNMVDCMNFEEYIETFGDFFTDQIEQATCNLLSHAKPPISPNISSSLREVNPNAPHISGWFEADSSTLYELLYLDSAKEFRTSYSHDVEPHHPHHAPPCDVTCMTPNTQTSHDALAEKLNMLSNIEYGKILRAKGIVGAESEGFFQFDYLPGLCEIRHVHGDFRPAIMVIGNLMDNDAIKRLFEEA